jgi:exonuclease VII small subunit
MVVTVAVALAAVVFVIQTAVVFGLYRAVKLLQERAEPLMESAEPAIEEFRHAIEKVKATAEQAGPVIEKIGPVLDQAVPAFQRAGAVLESAQKILEDSRPRVSEIATEVAGIARSGRQQVERIGELLDDAGSRAHARLDQLDRSVDGAIEQVELVAGTVKRAVEWPVREITGITAFIGAALATLVRRRRSSVNEATQDEEMFI